MEIGQISSEAAAAAKARVSELHHALVSAVSEEQALTMQAAQLAKDREVRSSEMQLLIHGTKLDPVADLLLTNTKITAHVFRSQDACWLHKIN